MLHALEHAFEHTVTDVVQAIPILIVVYALLYWICLLYTSDAADD